MKKILKGQLRANKSNSNFDLIDSLDTSFLEKVNFKFCKFVLGIGKKSVNISQYPLNVYIKLQVLKYMARISNKDNNPLLLDAYSLSKTVHLNGTYSWYTFAENILNTKSLKKTLLKNYENMFFEKLRSFNINNKLFLYSKIKTNYIIEPFIENSNFENRKLIVKMRISDHVLEIERGRYNKINSEQRICRQCHLNVIEDEEHFFFHCQKNPELS
jgi:hypothetical protein